MKLISALVISLTLAGCSSGLDRRIDGSGETAFERSLAGMKKSASPEQIAQLDEALLLLAIADVSIGYEGGILGALQKISIAKSPEQLADRLMPLVNGMSGREIIKAGQKRKNREAGKQLALVETEITQLSQRREMKAGSAAILAPIEIIEPTLRFSSIGPQKMSVMDFKVKNGTDVALTYLYLRGSVTAAAGGTLLYSDDINYKLSAEPLRPGETKALRLPNAASGKWNAPEIWGKENLAFTIVVVNAENMAGQKLAASFTHQDGERLATLTANQSALAKLLAD